MTPAFSIHVIYYKERNKQLNKQKSKTTVPMKCSKRAQTRGPGSDSRIEKERGWQLSRKLLEEEVGRGGVACTWRWDEVEEAGPAGPAAISCQLPMWSPGACSGRVVLWSYFTTATLNRWSHGLSGCWNVHWIRDGIHSGPFRPSVLISKSVGVMHLDMPTKDNSRKQTRGLLLSSWVPLFSTSQSLMPTLGRQGAKDSLMDKFSKGQHLLKSSQIFFYHPYVK